MKLKNLIILLEDHKEDIIQFFAKHRGFAFQLNERAIDKFKKDTIYPKRNDNITHRLYTLSLLSATISRMLEDVKPDSNTLKPTVYAIDSTEFQAYVNPMDNLMTSFFNIEEEYITDELRLKKGRQRKYIAEVLFDKKEVDTANIKNSILHTEHQYEVDNYGKWLYENLFGSQKKLSEKLIEYLDNLEDFNLPTGTPEKRAEKAFEKILEEKKFFNVFNDDFVKKISYIKRFKDIQTNSGYYVVNNYPWETLLEDAQTEHIEHLKSLKYNQHLFRVFYEIFDHFNFHRSERSLKIDCKVLAYVCTLNTYFSQNNIKHRVALLSSSSLVNVFSRSLINYFEYIDQFDNKRADSLRDVLYVRFPTLLANQIDNSLMTHLGGELSQLLKLIDDLFFSMNQNENYCLKNQQEKTNAAATYDEAIEVRDSQKLKEISTKWNLFRDNLLYEKNIIQVEELNKSDEGKSQNPLLNSIKDIGYEHFYATIKNINENLIDELIDFYLKTNAYQLNYELKAILSSIECQTKGYVRYLIKSIKKNTCQNVFQVPKQYIKEKIIEKQEGTKDIYTLNVDVLFELKKTEQRYLYTYTCAILSALIKDWTTVELVCEKFIEDYSDSSNEEIKLFLEEVYYIIHLSKRNNLFKKRSLTTQGENSLESSLKDVLSPLNKAKELNERNPRLKLSQISFDMEKAILLIEKNDLANKDSEHLKMEIPEYKNIYEKEFINSDFNLGDNKDFINKHPFKNNLISMYYKVLLSFFIYNVTSLRYGEFEEKKLKQQALVYFENLKMIVESQHEEFRTGDNELHLRRPVTAFVMEFMKQYKENSFDKERLRLLSKTLPKNTFFKRFIYKNLGNVSSILKSNRIIPRNDLTNSE